VSILSLFSRYFFPELEILTVTNVSHLLINMFVVPEKFMDVWEWSLQKATIFCMGPGIPLTKNPST